MPYLKQDERVAYLGQGNYWTCELCGFRVKKGRGPNSSAAINAMKFHLEEEHGWKTELNCYGLYIDRRLLA